MTNSNSQYFSSARRAICAATLVSLLVSGAALARVPQDGRGADVRTVTSLPSRETRWALIIGVDNYQKDISPLYGSVNDAKALKEALVTHAGFPEQQVILMTSDAADTDLLPTRGNILDALDRLSREVPENGLVLFSFSGHGLSIGGDAFLIPSDGRILQNPALMRERSIDVLRVKQAIQATKVRQVLMLLDACRNEPASGKGDGPNPLTEAYKGGFSFDMRNREVDAFATIYATSVGDRAFEFFDTESQQHRGFFSFAIVEALKGAVASEKGEVTLGSLIKYLEGTVRQRVYVEKNQRQVPYSVTEGYRNDELVLALAKRTAPNSAAAVSMKVSNYRRWMALLDRSGQATVALEAGAELTRDPGNGLALRARAGAYYLLDEMEKSRRDAEAAARLLAGAASADELEARCYVRWRLGQLDEALSDCTRALGLDPRNKWAYHYRANAYNDKREYDRAIADYIQAIEVDPAFASAHNSRGSVYHSKGEHERAIADFTRAIELDPKFALAYANRGALYYSQKQDYNRAVADQTRAIELNPKYTMAYYGRGLLFMNEREHDRASADFTKAIELEPKFTEAYISRGKSYSSKYEHDQAIADFTKASELEPKHASTHLAQAYLDRAHSYFDKDYDRAIADFTRAGELNPQLRTDSMLALTYFKRGNVYYTKGYYDRAIADFTRAIGLNPKLVLPYDGRADAYVNKKEYDRAIADFDKAIELDPKDASYYLRRGVVYHHTKRDFERALADYNKTLELNPKSMWAYVNRGMIYQYERREYDRAIADYNRALELDPKQALTYFHRGLTYYYKEDDDRAIADFDKVIELDPKEAGAYHNRGLAYQGKREYDLALADYTRALELDPKNAETYFQRGYTYSSKQEHDRAITDFTRAIELYPRASRAYHNRGRAYAAGSEYDRALADYTRAIEIEPTLVDAYIDRGVVHHNNKRDYDRAIADYTKAVEINPKYVLAYKNRALVYQAKGDSARAAADRQKAAELEMPQP